METMLETMEKSFDFLNPYEKAKFIGARLDWATNAALCGEITLRLCYPTKDNES